MKKIIMIICILIQIWGLYANTNMVVYNQYLYPIHPTKKYVQLIGISDSIQFKNTFPTIQLLSFVSDNLNNIVKSIKGTPNANLAPTYAIISTPLSITQLKSYSQIQYASPYFYFDSTLLGYSHFFYVKTRNDCDTMNLNTKAIQYGFHIEAVNMFAPEWKICRADKNSVGDALDLCDRLMNDAIVEIAEPDVFHPYQLACVNDSLFYRQWNLKNTNQHSSSFNLDINICPAWDSTAGDSNIIVAVFDAGISKSHPDLPPLYSSSYNCMTGLATPANNPTFPFSPPFPDNTYSHGTEVTSVIGAKKNNAMGVAGIAPKCKIMDIAYNFFDVTTVLNAIRIANGFDTARRRGASVINCSWGINYKLAGQTTTEGLVSPTINGAITRALTLGRNGLGCVVVFATGNFFSVGDYDYIWYPANAHPDILAVGGMDVNGKKAEEIFELVSHYGPEMDILAPGVRIPTLNYNPNTNQHYMDTSTNGTSVAAPQVAGVAALLLSINPSLTQRQIGDIIESTATKLPHYATNYANVTGRLNGTFFIESGYGLLNAHSAILKITQSLNPCPTVYFDNQSVTSPVPPTVGCIIESTNSKIIQGAKIFDHEKEVHLHNGFEVYAPAIFEIINH